LGDSEEGELMRHVQSIAIFIIFLISVSTVAAAQARPGAFLKKQDRKLGPLLKDTEKNRAKILKIVNKILDFQTLCKDSLGKHWDTRTETDRTEFTSTLQALIEKNLVSRLKDSRDHKLVYGREEISGKTASVITVIASNDDPRAEKTEIEYKMHKSGKAWSVIDMVTDGVSLVGNYRSQFNKIITEDGWDVLMKKMKDKLVE
jgi:phospholipid transport system substrate-binding protein